MSIKPITLILTKLSIKNDNNNEAKPEPVEPKKRGRPKKIISEDKETLIEPKKRGRPKKNNTVVLINREEVTEPKESKKRGRPKKNINITIANDTSSESSCENNEPKKRGRPRKTELKPEKPKKIYCGIEDPIPKNSRRGSMKECLDANKVNYFGIKTIDTRLLESIKKNKELEFTTVVKMAGLRGLMAKTRRELDKATNKTEKKKLSEVLDKSNKELLILN